MPCFRDLLLIKYRHAYHSTKNFFNYFFMQKITLLIAFSFCILFSKLYGQVGIGTLTPNTSAMLDVSSTNKGLLIPRVALTGTTDVVTIPTPAVSLLVYNTATNGAGSTAVRPGYYYWNGTGWVVFISGSTPASSW